MLLHLAPIEHEVRDERDGRWFLTRLLPYRTMEDQVAGVVLTLINITENKRAAADLEKSESRFRALVTQAKAGIVEMDLGEALYLCQRSLLRDRRERPGGVAGKGIRR